jgi:hypothetical protein
MAFYYRRPIEGDAVQPVKDFTIASGVTIVQGDIVKLDSSGNVIKSVADDTVVLGVAEGTDFVNGKAKVRLAADAVYEAEYVGAGALTIGKAYGINGSSQMDTAEVTALLVKIVEVVNGKPYVVITGRLFV